jgi:hypothetical protein
MLSLTTVPLCILLLLTTVLAGQYGETFPMTFGEVNMCVPPRDGGAPIPPTAFALMSQIYRLRFGSGQEFDEPGQVGACCRDYCLVLSHTFSADRDWEGVEAPFYVTAEQFEDALLQLAACVDLAAQGSVALFGRLWRCWLHKCCG